MAKLTVQQIRDLARAIVVANPGGIRYTPLVQEILKQHPGTPKNTIGGSVYNLNEIFPGDVSKPSRGLYTPTAAPEHEGGGCRRKH